MSFLIYCFRHESGKGYVGLTCRTLAHRWGQHVSKARNGKGGCPAFYAAIRKYGPESFTSEVLEVLPDLASAQEAEKKWIHELGTLAPGGYNIELGGRVRSFSEETRRRMSQAALKREASYTPEQRREILSKIATTMTPEKRKDVVRKRLLTMTPEKLLEAGRKISAAMTEERKARFVQMRIAQTPEERRAAAKKGVITRKRNLGLL